MFCVAVLPGCSDGHIAVPVGVDRKAEILCRPYGGPYEIRYSTGENYVSIKVQCNNGMHLQRSFKYESTHWNRQYPELKLNETDNVGPTNR